MSKINSKIFISGSLLLLLMFIHLVSIINNCSSQVNSSKPVISAFSG
ncbi:MAG: hypothetical protein K6A44_07750 [bacterium]|nr:hypothetical protein [bacterium]